MITARLWKPGLLLRARRQPAGSRAAVEHNRAGPTPDRWNSKQGELNMNVRTVPRKRCLIFGVSRLRRSPIYKPLAVMLAVLLAPPLSWIGSGGGAASEVKPF